MRSAASADQLVDAGNRRVDRARGDQAQHPGHLDLIIASCASARSGRPKTVKEAGAGSVFHIASMAAIFIFWFWPAV